MSSSPSSPIEVLKKVGSTGSRYRELDTVRVDVAAGAGGFVGGSLSRSSSSRQPHEIDEASVQAKFQEKKQQAALEKTHSEVKKKEELKEGEKKEKKVVKSTCMLACSASKPHTPFHPNPTADRS